MLTAQKEALGTVGLDQFHLAIAIVQVVTASLVVSDRLEALVDACWAHNLWRLNIVRRLSLLLLESFEILLPLPSSVDQVEHRGRVLFDGLAHALVMVVFVTVFLPELVFLIFIKAHEVLFLVVLVYCHISVVLGLELNPSVRNQGQLLQILEPDRDIESLSIQFHHGRNYFFLGLPLRNKGRLSITGDWFLVVGLAARDRHVGFGLDLVEEATLLLRMGCLQGLLVLEYLNS